jgi:hypothetical protein
MKQLIYLILVFLIMSCSKKIYEPVYEKNKILYVSDKSGLLLKNEPNKDSKTVLKSVLE